MKSGGIPFFRVLQKSALRGVSVFAVVCRVRANPMKYLALISFLGRLLPNFCPRKLTFAGMSASYIRHEVSLHSPGLCRLYYLHSYFYPSFRCVGAFGFAPPGGFTNERLVRLVLDHRATPFPVPVRRRGGGAQRGASGYPTREKTAKGILFPQCCSQAEPGSMKSGLIVSFLKPRSI